MIQLVLIITVSPLSLLDEYNRSTQCRAFFSFFSSCNSVNGQKPRDDVVVTSCQITCRWLGSSPHHETPRLTF